MLSCEGLSVGYGGKPVLSGIGFDLRPGEVVAMLGPNGGGKTTLLKTLASLIPRIGGSVFFGVDELGSLSAREIARRVGFVPQEEAWRFEFSVQEVVAMGRLPVSNGFFDTDEDREAATEAMKQARCYELRDRPITELSGGERQRVLIARALCQNTPVVFLDEPTAHLDPQHQVATVSLLREMARAGKSLLVAVHDLPIAAAVADRGMLVSSGKASPVRPIEEILASPDLDGAYNTVFERLRSSEGRLVVVACTGR
ncbi:MAG: ABC transporter ATP-binding protein [Fimbriimonadales bacterium]